MDSLFLHEAGNIYGNAKFYDWQEKMASDRKSKFSSKYGQCLDNMGQEKKNGTGKLGDWQENIASGRKCKVSSKYEQSLDNMGHDK